MYIKWKPVLRTVRWAQSQLAIPMSDVPIDELLSRNFGIDVSDPRQLYCLMTAMNLYASVVTEGALGVRTNDFFEIDQMQANMLAFSVMQSYAVLTLKLSEHLPSGVVTGKVKQTQVPDSPTDPATFNWSAVTPSPPQLERYEMWQRVVTARETPAQAAARRQAQHTMFEVNSDALVAYTNMVSCMVLMLLAADLGDEEVPTEAAQRFRDVTIVTAYHNLPDQYRSLASDG